MKYFYTLLFAILVASSHSAIAQDISISLSTESPNPVTQGNSGTVKVTICNNGLIPLLANRVRPLISFPSSLTVNSVTVISGTGWDILSNDGQTIRLQNTSVLSLLPATCNEIILGYTGINIGGPLTVTGTLGFNGSQTIGNITSNDNSTSTIAVLAPCAVLAFTATDPSTCLGNDGQIRLCGFVPNHGGYTINYTKNGVTAPSLTNQTADASGCITINGLTAGNYTNIHATSPGCPLGSNIVAATLSDPIPPAPTALSASPATICQGESSTLSATCASGTVTWYSDSGLTTLLPSTTVNPTENTIYYVACVSSTGCKSASANITVTVNQTPNAPTDLSATPPTINVSVSTTHVLSGNCTTGTLTWFSDSNLTVEVQSPVNPTSTTTYYASCVSTVGCKSISVPLTISLIPDLTPTIEIGNLQFTTDAEQRDFVVNIFEINGAAQMDGTQVSFRLAKLSAFDITFSLISGTSNVFGGIQNSNDEWTFTEDTNFITVTAKQNSLPAGGSKVIGFTLARKTEISSNTSQNITATIINGSAGENFYENNIVVTTITAN